MVYNKCLVLFALIFILYNKSYSQYHITYKYDYFSNNGDTLQPVLGDDIVYQDYYFMDGRYKSIYDRGSSSWIDTYDSEKNTRYEIDSEGKIFEYDASKKTSDLKEIVHLDSTVVIMGYVCKSVKLIQTNITSIYFYTDKIKIDPISLKDHGYGNWNRIIDELDGAVPIKYVEHYSTGYYEANPILIKKISLTKEDFKPKSVLKKLRIRNQELFKMVIDSVYAKYGSNYEFNSISASGKVIQQKLSIPMNIVVKKPSSFYIKMSFAGTEFIISRTSKESWQYNPMEDKVEFEKIDSEEIQRDIISEFSPMTNREWEDYNVLDFREELDDYRIVADNKGKIETLFINKSNFLVEKRADADNIYYYDDYANFKESWFPKKFIQFKYNEQNPTFSMIIDDVSFNVDVPDSLFNIPRDFVDKIEVKKEVKTDKEYYQEAEQLLEKKNYSEAIQLYKKAIELNYNNVLYHNQLGISLLRSEDNYGAIAAFSKAIELNEDYNQGWYNLGYTKMLMGDIKAAIPDLNRAIKLKPSDPQYLTYKGLCYYNLQNYDSSLVSFMKVLEVDSKYKVGFWNIAMSLYQLKKYNQALEYFTKSLSIGYSSSDLYNYRGICYYKLDNFNQALEDFKEATKSDSPTVDYYQNLGNAYSELNDSKQAIKSYNKAIQMDSTFAEGYNLVGLEYFNEGSYKAAITSFSKAISITDNNAVYYDNRGQAKDGLMDFVGAIDDYSTSITLYPDDGFIYYLRGRAKKNIDDKFDSCKDFKKASELGDENAKEMLDSYCNGK